MTPWHYRWLCQFAYIDLPDDLPHREAEMHSVCRELLRRDQENLLACGSLSDSDREALRIILRTEALSRLRIIGYVNRNSTSGFSAYALRASDGSVHCLFRGSEGVGCGVPTAVGWIDNFLAPFRGSVQYKDAAAFAAPFSQRSITFSGHSKGAHNALYALAVSPNRNARAVVFNGQGFAPRQLTPSAEKALAQRGVNYVTRGDLVGILLRHPEKRIFVRRRRGEHPHSLGSFCFDADRQIQTASPPIWAAAVGWLTALAAS
jgi:hypothetical protein